MKPGVRLKTLAPGLVLLATLVAVAYVVQSGVLRGLLSEDWIDRDVRGKGAPGELLFIAVSGILTALAVPRHVVSFLGGYAFGVLPGTLFALLGTEVGCLLNFFYARDRKSTRLNSSHIQKSRMPSSA